MKSAKTVRDIVLGDYRTADVFKKWGINYCCSGNMALAEACTSLHLDRDVVEADLQQAVQTINLPSTIAFDQWPLEFLTDYIIYVHHAYLRNTLPLLKEQMQTFVSNHLVQYPHLKKVQDTFHDLATELEEHIVHEEESIFPYIKQINFTYNRREVYGRLFVRTMSKPLAQVVESDHNRIRSLLLQLRAVTDNYTFLPDACANYQVVYQKLKELDADLVQHKHLENNILIPKAMAMEKSLLQL